MLRKWFKLYMFGSKLNYIILFDCLLTSFKVSKIEELAFFEKNSQSCMKRHNLIEFPPKFRFLAKIKFSRQMIILGRLYREVRLRFRHTRSAGNHKIRLDFVVPFGHYFWLKLLSCSEYLDTI